MPWLCSGCSLPISPSLTISLLTWSIDSQIIIIALGSFVTSLFFHRKQPYKAKYKEFAYRTALRHSDINTYARLKPVTKPHINQINSLIDEYLLLFPPFRNYYFCQS